MAEEAKQQWKLQGSKFDYRQAEDREHESVAGIA